MRKVYFRADGNSQIGLGHVIRSCAVAEMLREEFNCFFLIRQPSAYLQTEIKKSGCSLVELPDTISYEVEAAEWALSLDGSEIIVLDGYNFTTTYQQTLKLRGSKLVCIDDIHACHFAADAVINHAGGVTVGHYSSLASTQFFLGLKYSLLRKEFGQPVIKHACATNLLISLGGADPNNETLQVLQQVANAGFSQIHVLVGAGYRYDAVLHNYLKTYPVQTTVYKNLDAAAITELMLRCFYAVLSPSSICFEFMTTTGVVFLYQIADNQEAVKRFFLDQELAFAFSDFKKLPVETEKEVVEKQNQMFDGKYPERIRTIFSNLSFFQNLHVRKVTIDDMETTFQWANDKLARSMSLNSTPIAFHDHSRWFEKKVTEHHSFYYILEAATIPFAQIRFDYKQDGNYFLLSYSIDAAYRGKSFGSFVLAAGLQQLQNEVKVAFTVVAYVKKENKASVASFKHTKFQLQTASDITGTLKYSLTI